MYMHHVLTLIVLDVNIHLFLALITLCIYINIKLYYLSCPHCKTHWVCGFIYLLKWCAIPVKSPTPWGARQWQIPT